jgi:8-oxo-dGTP diphosphatase
MNLLGRLAYRLAFRLLRVWWFLRRPEAEGAAVLVWRDDALLLVRTSYRTPLDLPGGGIGRDEAPLAAARRELREETGLEAPAIELEAMGVVAFGQHHRRIRAHLFRWSPSSPVFPRADEREIVWAGFVPRERLGEADLDTLPRLALAGRAQLPTGTRQMS